MKLLFCATCGDIQALHYYKAATCNCGKCMGRYTEPFKGQAVFTEVGESRPKNIWVLGIPNPFLNNLPPDYRIYKEFLNIGMEFKTNETLLLRIRPGDTGDTKFVKQRDFFK